MITAVLSDGGWGTALALLLHKNGHTVRLWGAFPDYTELMRKTRTNPRFLAGVSLPESLFLTASLEEAVANAELVVLASPAQYLRSLLQNLSRLPCPSDRLLVSVAKGIEVQTLCRMSQLVSEYFPHPQRLVVLSGPSHAEEVAREVPTAVVAAATDPAAAQALAAALMNPFFRVYMSSDVVGVELGGALKNVLALAAGICDGMAFGDNTKAALMTRGMVELARLGKALGGKPETFFGLSGIGDLIVTCTSRHSRNRHVGEELGKGRKLADIQAEFGRVVAEGIATAQSAFQLARQQGVDTPIIDEVYASLYLDKDPRLAVRDLMSRRAKPELPDAFFG